MEVLNRLHANQAVPGAKRREHDESTIGLADLPDLVHSAQQNAINLGRRDRDILGEESDTGQKLMDAELGLLDRLGRVTRDQDLGRVPTLGIGRAVTVAVRKRRREVDGRVGHRLNELDVLAVPATQELVHRRLKGRGIDDSPELDGGQHKKWFLSPRQESKRTSWSMWMSTRVLACSEDR